MLAKPLFPAAQYQLLEAMRATFEFTMQGLQNAKISIKHLRTMLCGPRNESHSRLLEDLDEGAPTATAVADTSATQSIPAEARVKPPAPKRPGHGRIGADAYRGPPVIELAVTEVRAGEVCLECGAGKACGSPPQTATVYKRQHLCCRLCGTIFTAALPVAVSATLEFDLCCASVLALLHHGNGVPLRRLHGRSSYEHKDKATQSKSRTPHA